MTMTPELQIFTSGNPAEAVADLLDEHSPARVRGWCLSAIDLNELGAAQNSHDQELVDLYEEHAAMCRVVADLI